MSDTKHTPGPWKFYFDSVSPKGTTVWSEAELNAKNISHIATVDCTDSAAREANARLIAASPDLLNALRYIRDECTGLPAHARALADHAIRKAQP